MIEYQHLDYIQVPEIQIIHVNLFCRYTRKLNQA